MRLRVLEQGLLPPDSSRPRTPDNILTASASSGDKTSAAPSFPRIPVLTPVLPSVPLEIKPAAQRDIITTLFVTETPIAKDSTRDAESTDKLCDRLRMAGETLLSIGGRSARFLPVLPKPEAATAMDEPSATAPSTRSHRPSRLGWWIAGGLAAAGLLLLGSEKHEARARAGG